MLFVIFFRFCLNGCLMENRNAHQIIEAIVAGESFEIEGQFTGSKYVIEKNKIQSGFTIRKTVHKASGMPQSTFAKKPINVGMVKTLAMIEFQLQKSRK